MDANRLREWIDLKASIVSLESEVDEMKKRASALEEEILDEMATEEIKQVNIDGISAYIKREVYVSIDYLENEDTDAGYSRVTDILEKNGLGHIAHKRFNLRTLTKHIREMMDEGQEEVPEEFKGALKASVKYQLVPRGIKNRAKQMSEV